MYCLHLQQQPPSHAGFAFTAATREELVTFLEELAAGRLGSYEEDPLLLYRAQGAWIYLYFQTSDGLAYKDARPFLFVRLEDGREVSLSEEDALAALGEEAIVGARVDIAALMEAVSDAPTAQELPTKWAGDDVPPTNFDLESLATPGYRDIEG